MANNKPKEINKPKMGYVVRLSENDKGTIDREYIFLDKGNAYEFVDRLEAERKEIIKDPLAKKYARALQKSPESFKEHIKKDKKLISLGMELDEKYDFFRYYPDNYLPSISRVKFYVEELEIIDC